MSAAVTAWLVVPEPADWLEVLVKVARVELVPHSNQAFVAWPFGFTLPFAVAPLEVIKVAAFVVAAGATAAAATVTEREAALTAAWLAVVWLLES